MQLGIFAKTFPGEEPNAVLGQAKRAGYRTVQYNLSCSGLPSMPDRIDKDTCSAIRQACETTGVELCALSATYNMIHPDPSVRETGHRRLSESATAARLIGTNLLTLCTGTRNPEDQWQAHADNGSTSAWRDLRRSMETAIDIAEAHQVYLGIEPELANVVNSAQKAVQLIEEMRSDRLKIVLDPANLFDVASTADQRGIISEAIELLADRIVLAHAKDRTADGTFATAGKGVLDYDHYIRCLEEIGFDGPLVAHGLRPTETAGVASFLGSMLDG